MINTPKPKESVAVFDSSALIVVAKLDALDDWRTMCGRLLVLPGVEQECIEERVPQGGEDVQRIQNALQAGTLTRVALATAQLKQTKDWHERSHLGLGECEVLAYVHSTANTIAIFEDRVGGAGRPPPLSHHRTCGPRIRRFVKRQGTDIASAL